MCMSGEVVRSVKLDFNLHLSLALHHKAEPKYCENLMCNCTCDNDATGQQAKQGRVKAVQQRVDVRSQHNVWFVG